MPRIPIDPVRPASPGAARLGAPLQGSAARTDARVSVLGLLGLLRPGPGAGDPIAPGPRAPVAPSALLAIPLRRTERGDVQLAQLARRPGDAIRPQLTAEQEVGRQELRRAVVGRSRPLSYVYRFVGRVGSIVGSSTEAAAETSEARDPLPCIDCGG